MEEACSRALQQWQSQAKWDSAAAVTADELLERIVQVHVMRAHAPACLPPAGASHNTPVLELAPTNSSVVLLLHNRQLLAPPTINHHTPVCEPHPGGMGAAHGLHAAHHCGVAGHARLPARPPQVWPP